MKRLVIVDLSSFIFRAFYAIPMLTSPDGTPVNAVYGVFSMLLKLFSTYRPTHILIARDAPNGSKTRKEIYTDYKAHRSAPPEALIAQISLIDELITAMGIFSYQQPEHEADDVIGSLVKQQAHRFDEVYIVTGDKDLMQFVGEHIYVIDTKLDKIFGIKEVEEKMGVPPHLIVDYLSIVGDSSDNIPGVKGVGHKGAVSLLKEFDSLEKALAGLSSLKNNKLRTAMESYKADALLSKKLVNIVTNLKMQLGADVLSALAYEFTPTANLLKVLQKFGLKSQIKKLQEQYKTISSSNGEEVESTVSISASTLTVTGSSSSDHEIIKSSSQLNKLLNKLENDDWASLAVIFSYDNNDIFDSKIQSITFNWNGVNSHYWPLSLIGDQIALERCLTGLWNKKEGRKGVVLGYGLKRDIAQILAYGKRPKDLVDFFDILSAHYAVDISTRHDLEFLSSTYLKRELPTLGKDVGRENNTKQELSTKQEELKLEFDPPDKKGKGGKKSLENDIINENNDFLSANYYGERASAIYQLGHILRDKLKELNLEQAFYEIDNPLIPVLAEMEKDGMAIDLAHFKKLEKNFSQELKNIEEKITKITKEDINLKSPKQVAELLFEKLQLPVIRKTKTINSTDSDVLESLSGMGISEVPGLILNYRKLDKLLSTYVTVLPGLVNPFTKRIHTSFNIAVTATGRLSSERPNLQNIPVRSADGKKIREGFVASPGCKLFAADYSQIELRLLAHFSQDKTMLKAFAEEKDIHRETAAEIFGIELSEVSDEQRASAKAVNFGLMYGQSSFGLAEALKIGQWDAKRYITTYFERFCRVKEYIDSLKEICAQKGYAETLFGRKRFLPEIHSQNRTVRNLAERLAVNTPIQGTAADIIKLAMIKIDRELKQKKFKAKMLLQVHDELIFEVPEKELAALQALVTEQMEGAVKLKVPLRVEVGTDYSWPDTH